MNQQDLYDRLKALKAYIADRVDLANLVVDNHLIDQLINYCDPSQGVSHQSCWVLEQVFLRHENICSTYLQEIIQLYKLLINHSGMRSLLKIALIICQKFYSKKTCIYDEKLSLEMRETLVDGCFGELVIATGKSANLMFATKALFLLGRDFPWVHEQLPAAIEKHLDNSDNKGYRSGAIAILKKLQE